MFFRTGPDASLNSLALKLSGIDRDFKVSDGGAGFIEKDATGEPTGILRNCTRFVKVKDSGKPPGEEDYLRRLGLLFADYNSAGITTICDRDAKPETIERYKKLRDRQALSVRLNLLRHIENIGLITNLQADIRSVARDPLFQERAREDWLRIIGVKTYLDGGMLTGSAFMREPWGVSQTNAITDPTNRGVLFIPRKRLGPLVRAAVESGLQFTAHSVGDVAVQELMEAYAEVNRDLPIQKTRPCITHANFLSREAVERLPKLGVALDIQRAWLFLDTHTLTGQFNDDRMKWFQPWRSFLDAGGRLGGGSDHMQKVGSLRGVNPYHPFLGMATAITRRAKGVGPPLHPEECLTREQATYPSGSTQLIRILNDLASRATSNQATNGHSHEIFNCWQAGGTSYPRRTQRSVLNYTWQNTFAPYTQAGGFGGGSSAVILMFDMMEPHASQGWPSENSPNRYDGHGQDGGNAVFADGHATWTSAKGWRETIVKSQDYPSAYPLAP